MGGRGGAGGSRGGRSFVTEHVGDNIEVLKTIPFKDSIFGTSVTINYKAVDSCTTCSGSGLKAGAKRILVQHVMVLVKLPMSWVGSICLPRVHLVKVLVLLYRKVMSVERVMVMGFKKF